MWHKIFTWRQHCDSRIGKQKWQKHQRKRWLRVHSRCKKPANVMRTEVECLVPAFLHAKTPTQRIQRLRKCRRKNSNLLQTVRYIHFKTLLIFKLKCYFNKFSFYFVQNWRNPEIKPQKIIAKRWKKPWHIRTHRKLRKISPGKIHTCRPPAPIIMIWTLAAQMDLFHAAKIHHRFRDTAIGTKWFFIQKKFITKISLEFGK